MIPHQVIRTVRFATEKQKALLDAFGIKYKKKITLAEASQMISKEIERRKAERKNRPRGGRRLLDGRLHGFQPVFGCGAIHYSYGVMDYCDDGNGNEWSLEDDFGMDEW